MESLRDYQDANDIFSRIECITNTRHYVENREKICQELVYLFEYARQRGWDLSDPNLRYGGLVAYLDCVFYDSEDASEGRDVLLIKDFIDAGMNPDIMVGSLIQDHEIQDAKKYGTSLREQKELVSLFSRAFDKKWYQLAYYICQLSCDTVNMLNAVNKHANEIDMIREALIAKVKGCESRKRSRYELDED